MQCVIDLPQSALGFRFLSHLPVGLALKPRLSLSASASASASVHHTNPKPKIPSIQTLFQLLSQRDREREREAESSIQFQFHLGTYQSFISLLNFFVSLVFKKKKNCFTSISRFILETLDSLLDLVCLAVENM